MDQAGSKGNGGAGVPGLEASRSRPPCSALWPACAVIVLLILLLMPSRVGSRGAGSVPTTPTTCWSRTTSLGWEGLAGIERVSRPLRAWSFFRAAALPLIRPKQVLDQADKWDALIEDLQKEAFPEKTICIVVALHGGSDSKGAYLIPDKMAGPEDRLELSDMSSSRWAGFHARSRRSWFWKLRRLPANWQLGMLHNDFAPPACRPRGRDRKVPRSLGLERGRRRSAVLGFRGTGSNGVQPLSDRSVARQGIRDTTDRSRWTNSTITFLRNVRDWVWNARGARSRSLCSYPEPRMPVVARANGRPAEPEKPGLAQIGSSWPRSRMRPHSQNIGACPGSGGLEEPLATISPARHRGSASVGILPQTMATVSGRAGPFRRTGRGWRVVECRTRQRTVECAGSFA